MIDFILRYWIEALLGVCLLLIGYIYKLVKKDIKEYFTKEAKVLIEQERSIYQADIKALREKDEGFNNSLHGLKDDMYSLKRGILSIQGKVFKEKCEALLNAETITTQQYEDLLDDHEAYNGLGGNHYGDQLFDLVTKKYQAQVSK